MGNIAISDHFDSRKIIKFTIPTIITLIVTSIYSVVDGIFIANVVGTSAFAAVNFAMPLLMLPGSFGLMFGVGGSALSSKLLGQGKKKEAQEAFSLSVIFTFILGIFFVIVGEIFMEPFLKIMGAEGSMLEMCLKYGRVFLITAPFIMAQFASQILLAAIGRPKVCLALTLAAGIGNAILDALFIAVFKWGLVGAAAASCIGQVVAGLGAMIYYYKHKENDLHLIKPKFSWLTIGRMASNGLADCLANLSTSIVNMLFNIQLLKYLGENGVSAYGIIMYISFIFVGVMLGLASGMSPIVSYNYGSNNNEELHNVVKRTITLEIIASIVLTIIAELVATPLASIFTGGDAELLRISSKAIRLFCLNYLLAGINIYVSAMFGALNNGKIASVIAVLRTMVFQLSLIFILPLIIDAELIFLAVAIAEVLAAIVSIFIFKKYQKVYRY